MLNRLDPYMPILSVQKYGVFLKLCCSNVGVSMLATYACIGIHFAKISIPKFNLWQYCNFPYIIHF